MPKHKYLIVVCGPTASGKTSLGIALAQHFNTEIISSDSRQFYKEMHIGTAKPSQEEQQAAIHHFINNLSIHDHYSVGKFEEEGLQKLNELFTNVNPVIMVGGSGLYIQAILEGFDQFPEVDPKHRLALSVLLEKEGIEVLSQEIKKSDPLYFQQADMLNPHRVIRALEIIRGTGKPFSSFLNQGKSKRNFNTIKVAIDYPREQLYTRINQRVDIMLEQGLVAEAKALFPLRHLNALQTVGYSELFDYFAGKHDLKEAVRLIKRNTRRFAKRQLTWYRKDPSIQYFEPNANEDVIRYCTAQMTKN